MSELRMRGRIDWSARWAVSIRQPYADLIVTGQKDIENRTWRPPPQFIGTRVWIHAGKKPMDNDSWISPPSRRGGLVGQATFVDVVTDSDSQWFSGPYGWVVAEPAWLDPIISGPGRLNFFRVIGVTERATAFRLG